MRWNGQSVIPLRSAHNSSVRTNSDNSRIGGAPSALLWLGLSSPRYKADKLDFRVLLHFGVCSPAAARSFPSPHPDRPPLHRASAVARSAPLESPALAPVRPPACN